MALTTVNSDGMKDDSIKNADIKSDAAIAKSKLAGLDIVNADINASAAISPTKIDAASFHGIGATGHIDVKNETSVKFYEASANGTNKIAVKAPATLGADYTLTLPPDDGDNLQFLQTNGSGVTDWVTVSAGGISDVVSDTSPQLGGNLDVNAKNILIGDSSDGASDDVLIFGAGSDVKHYWDNGASKYLVKCDSQTIQQESGWYYVRANNFSVYNSAGTETVAKFLADGACELYYNNAQKLKTTSSGAMVDAGMMELENDDSKALLLKRRGSDGTIAQFKRQASIVGNISVDSSSTTYATSSDYRLKENQVSISDGITRVKTLKPYRFNFKADSSKTVDGFFAHEVTAVPEAITGTKDETEDILYIEEDTIPTGKKVGDVKETVPKYQGIDQSKLVPLLTAALQEAIAKIETLETKVAALEAG